MANLRKTTEVFQAWLANENILVACGFLIFNLFIRLWSFWTVNLDFDEPIYLTIGQLWTKGYWPYTTFFDHKPIGIYVLSALMHGLFGPSIFPIRLLCVLLTTMGAYHLYYLTRKLFGQSRIIAILAALFYSLLIFNTHFLTILTTIAFSCYTIASNCVVVGVNCLFDWQQSHEGRPTFWLGLAALMFGLALSFHLHGLYDMLFWSLFLLGTLYKIRMSRTNSLLSLLVWTVGIGLPYLLVILTYLANGHFNDWVQTFLLGNLHYSQVNVFAVSRWLDIVLQCVQENPYLMLLWLAIPWALWKLVQHRGDVTQVFSTPVIILTSWLLWNLVGIVGISKLRCNPYFMSVAAPYSLLLAAWVYFGALHLKQRAQPLMLLCISLLSFCLLNLIGKPFWASYQTLDLVGRYGAQAVLDSDRYTKIAHHVDSVIRPDQTLLNLDLAYVYYLTNRTPPTHFVNWGHFVLREFEPFGALRPHESEEILTRQPDVILIPEWLYIQLKFTPALYSSQYHRFFNRMELQYRLDHIYEHVYFYVPRQLKNHYSGFRL